MDCSKTGKLIYALRKEKGMTQRDIALCLGISEQAVSKWERGLGCPDVTLLKELADILEVNTSTLLSGELSSNDADGGNMKKVKFYVCPDCGDIVTSTGNANVSCCGKQLSEQIIQTEEEGHQISIETIDDEFHVSMEAHPMEKEHFLAFIAYVTSDKLYVNRLYPEQSNAVRFRKSGHGILYAYCSEHGLFRKRI